MKQSERTAPESRIREIRSYGLNEGERETVIAHWAVNPYPLSTLPEPTPKCCIKKSFLQHTKHLNF